MVYPISDEDRERLERVYQYHEPKNDQPARYAALRNEAARFAELILELCPPSRERSLALSQLEVATMQANAAIARNE